jgi:hypothetical protein
MTEFMGSPTIDPYSEFRAALTQAGFYAPLTENMGTWQRIIPCSTGPPEHRCDNGRSFWVALVGGTWYVGAWGSYVYRLANPDDLLPMTRAFLTDTGTIGDFSDPIKTQFGLTLLDDDETMRILPDGRPDRR